jgi:hypothetical protein
MQPVYKTDWQVKKVMKEALLATILRGRGQKYSEVLGIDVSNGETEIFKWFVASVLFGAPISEATAIKTYRCFEKHGVLAPVKMLKTGWNGLVSLLDEGGYTRYDYKTADKITMVMKNLTAKYSGNLDFIHDKAVDSHDLEERLEDLGKGIGEVTVSIFLRDLRGVWAKAESKPTNLEILAAEELGILKSNAPAEETLETLKAFWNENRVAGHSFVNFETALLRIGRELRKKRKGSDPAA